MTVKITNIVGSGNLGRELDIEAIEEDLSTPYLEYDPSNYHGLYVRIEENGPLITVYRTGKYIITGPSTFDKLTETSNHFINSLSDLDIIDRDLNPDLRVQNIVCTATLEQEVQLDLLAISLGMETTEYEPEQFAGLIYRPNEHSAVLLVFANGKVVITGAPDLETANEAFRHLRTQIEQMEQ